MKRRVPERREWNPPPQPFTGPGEKRPQHFRMRMSLTALSGGQSEKLMRTRSAGGWRMWKRVGLGEQLTFVSYC